MGLAALLVLLVVEVRRIRGSEAHRANAHRWHRGRLLLFVLLESRVNAIENTRPASSLIHWIRDAAEAAAYGFVYAVAAALTGGWADIIFAWGPSSDYDQYSAVRLIFEFALQASFNAAVAQILRQAVTAIPIDEISDNKVPARNGGIVFAFVTFSRQPRWKAKVLALNAALGRTRIFG